jgi:esterase/lipase superfamily enzyme
MVNALKHKIDQGWLQLYCIDGIYSESFYCNWAHPSGRIKRHIDYEEYILKEVLPFMHAQNDHECVISHGLSLGAFHAANIAFRHPHLFKKLAAFSGRYDLTLSVESFQDLLDGYYSDDVYFHTPSHFLPNLESEEVLANLRAMDIILVIGNEDPFLENNQHLSSILQQKGINHQLILWNARAHSGYYWRRMAPLYI